MYTIFFLFPSTERLGSSRITRELRSSMVPVPESIWVVGPHLKLLLKMSFHGRSDVVQIVRGRLSLVEKRVKQVG